MNLARRRGDVTLAAPLDRLSRLSLGRGTERCCYVARRGTASAARAAKRTPAHFEASAESDVAGQYRPLPTAISRRATWPGRQSSHDQCREPQTALAATAALLPSARGLPGALRAGFRDALRARISSRPSLRLFFAALSSWRLRRRPSPGPSARALPRDGRRSRPLARTGSGRAPGARAARRPPRRFAVHLIVGIHALARDRQCRNRSRRPAHLPAIPFRYRSRRPCAPHMAGVNPHVLSPQRPRTNTRELVGRLV